LKKCDRCHQSMQWFTMSRFNTEDICNDCEGRERAHQKYQKAHDKELAEVMAGNMNYPGIGCPAELYLTPAKTKRFEELQQKFPEIQFELAQDSMFDGEQGLFASVERKGMAITNPFTSECGRFDVDPYKVYELSSRVAKHLVSFNKSLTQDHIDLMQEWGLLCSEKSLDDKAQVALLESFLEKNGLMGQFLDHARGEANG